MPDETIRRVGGVREGLTEGLTDTMAITDRTAQMYPRLTSAQVGLISGNGQRRNVRAVGTVIKERVI
jgi:hypothetical protein